MQELVSAGVRSYGRLAQRPKRVNPLEEYSGRERSWRSLRLKEWVGFTLVHPQLYSSMIIQDAHYLSSSELYVYEREAGSLAQHSSARGGSLGMPAGLAGQRCEYARPGYRLCYEFGDDGGTHAISVGIAATPAAPAITGELRLHAGGASAPLSVSARLPGGKLYTHKALFPAGGTLTVGDREYTFDPERDLAIIDEHKSFFPYRTRWLWGTLAARAADGRPLGANFCARPLAPGAEEESCGWTPGACEPLSDITFTQGTAGGPLAPWEVSSADGRLAVTFTPEGRKAVKHQLVLFDIDYFQLFGTYRGTLRSASGEAFPLDGVHGVLESFKARL